MTTQEKIQAELKDLLVRNEGSQILKDAKLALNTIFSLAIDGPLDPKYAQIVGAICHVVIYNQVDATTRAMTTSNDAMPALNLVSAIAATEITDLTGAVQWLKCSCNG